jgi:prolyl oligopeptidase family protein
VSPFMYADQFRAPILLIHGMADNNSGAFPIQSKRMYMALKGNGASVRYVQLPYEAHGYQARESIEHMIWEMLRWFDKYANPPRNNRSTCPNQENVAFPAEYPAGASLSRNGVRTFPYVYGELSLYLFAAHCPTITDVVRCQASGSLRVRAAFRPDRQNWRQPEVVKSYS